MIRIAHTAKLAGNGRWQAFADPDDVLTAVFFGNTRREVVTEAVRWLGGGDPLVTLDKALDGLEGALKGFTDGK